MRETGLVVRDAVASKPRWKVSSRRTERNADGMVADDRRIEILCERIGCSETRMLEGILSAVILLLFVVVTYYLLIAM